MKFENCRFGHETDTLVISVSLPDVSLGEGGLDGTSYCTGHLTGCLLYSCVNRLKRIYATFRGDEWINKRIINRNLISSTSK